MAKSKLILPILIRFLIGSGAQRRLGGAHAWKTCATVQTLSRSSYYLVGQKRLSSQKLDHNIIALSEEHPRYGYRRITALMRRGGKPVNAKRVQRVRLQVKERQKRTRRLGPTMVKRLRAQRANQVWSWDLLYDQTEHGPQSADPELD